MNKKLLLSLTIAATAFVTSCNKKDTNSTNGSTTLVPVTEFDLSTTAPAAVAVGGARYIAIPTVLPTNATLVTEAFTFMYGVGGTSAISTLVKSSLSNSRIKIEGVAAGAEVITIKPSGATSKASGKTQTVNITVAAVDKTQPASDFKVTAGGQTSANGALSLTVAQNAAIPLTFAGKDGNNPSVAITDFGTNNLINKVDALSKGTSTVTLTAGTANGTLQVSNTAGMEEVVIAANQNDDVNVKLSLTIVAPVTFANNTAVIGVITGVSIAGAATLPTLSTLWNGTALAADATNVTTGITANTALANDAVVQTISAGGILKIFTAATPALTAVPLGAYTAAIVNTTDGTRAGLSVTVNNDGSLVVKVADVTKLTANDSYTVTLTTTAATGNKTATFTIGIVA